MPCSNWMDNIFFLCIFVAIELMSLSFIYTTTLYKTKRFTFLEKVQGDIIAAEKWN